jgi:hypothetical protein
LYSSQLEAQRIAWNKEARVIYLHPPSTASASQIPRHPTSDRIEQTREDK